MRHRQWVFQGMRLCLAILLNFFSITPIWAIPFNTQRKTLAVLDFPEPDGSRCAEHMRQILIQSQRFNVWPRWYILQHLTPQHSDADWSALLSQLQVHYLVQGHVNHQDDRIIVSVLMAEALPSGKNLVFADLKSGHHSDLLDLCEALALGILGESLPTPPRSPALAASLSLVMPGAGHLYQGKPLNLLLGSAFLAGYLSLAWMGIRPQEEDGLSRRQWGGLLLLLSLTDVLLAYFLSQPEPGVSPL